MLNVRANQISVIEKTQKTETEWKKLPFRLFFGNFKTVALLNIMLATFIIIVFFFFFAIVGVAFIIAWQSMRDINVLGAVIVMWIVVALFLLVIYFGGRAREASKSTETGLVPCKITSEM